jgi:hypothetical protein
MRWASSSAFRFLKGSYTLLWRSGRATQLTRDSGRLSVFGQTSYDGTHKLYKDGSLIFQKKSSIFPTWKRDKDDFHCCGERMQEAVRTSDRMAHRGWAGARGAVAQSECLKNLFQDMG